MRYSLQPHPDHLPLAVRAIQVEVARDRDRVGLNYGVLGSDKVVRPDKLSPERADNLWRTTCLELFLRFDDDQRYVEFNFSPSTRWAAYAFDGYREGMAELACAPPNIERLQDGVAVALDLSALPHGALAMALTAVIEEEGGVKSFWSLAHPPGVPDFHHPACFAATLPPPRAP